MDGQHSRVLRAGWSPSHGNSHSNSRLASQFSSLHLLPVYVQHCVLRVKLDLEQILLKGAEKKRDREREREREREEERGRERERDRERKKVTERGRKRQRKRQRKIKSEEERDRETEALRCQFSHLTGNYAQVFLRGRGDTHFKIESITDRGGHPFQN